MDSKNTKTSETNRRTHKDAFEESKDSLSSQPLKQFKFIQDTERQNLDNKGEEEILQIPKPKEKPKWLVEDCLEFYKKVKLSQKDSEKLLKWFEKGKYNDEFKEEGEEINHVFHLLKSDIPFNYITCGKPQERFGMMSNKIFWNFDIMKKYISAFQEQGKRIYHFMGPQNLGKTFTLIYFRNLLSTSVKQTRVIYIHDLSLWLENKPLKFLLDQLQITFADRLLEQNYEELENLYQIAADSEECSSKLEDLLRCYCKEVGFTLIIDQYNALDKYKEMAREEPPQALITETYKGVSELILLIKSLAKKVFYVSSMTDKALKKEDQNQQRVFLSTVLDSETCSSFIEYKFGKVQEDEIEIIKESAGNLPGEISCLASCSANKLSEKILESEEKRFQEVSNSVKAFKTQRIKEDLYSERDLETALKEVASSLDLGFCLKSRLLTSYVDGRYIRIDENNHACSYFPVAGKAFRSVYYDRPSFIDSLEKVFQKNDQKITENLFEMIIMHEFCHSSKMIFHLKLMKRNTDEVLLEFRRLSEQRFATLDQIDFKTNESTLLSRPMLTLQVLIL